MESKFIPVTILNIGCVQGFPNGAIVNFTTSNSTIGYHWYQL